MDGLHKFIELRCVPEMGGYGLFATADIAEGEIVYNPTFDQPVKCWTAKQIEALPTEAQTAFRHFMYQVGEDSFNSAAEFDTLPIEEWASVTLVNDRSNYMNHSVCICANGI